MLVAAAIATASFDLFAAIVEQAPDAIIFADREGAIRVWSAHRGGTRLFVDLSFALVRDGSGVVGVLAIGRDCTARQDAKREMRARPAALENAFAAGAKPS